mmetsp:Transcript_27487/g.46280  ORF Transcript_27487/g.46280 Transcript_27487/m.46280 type:complete len:1094 (-) Transcript_27487:126-3407(-)
MRAGHALLGMFALVLVLATETVGEASRVGFDVEWEFENERGRGVIRLLRFRGGGGASSSEEQTVVAIASPVHSWNASRVHSFFASDVKSFLQVPSSPSLSPRDTLSGGRGKEGSRGDKSRLWLRRLRNLSGMQLLSLHKNGYILKAIPAPEVRTQILRIVDALEELSDQFYFHARRFESLQLRNRTAANTMAAMKVGDRGTGGHALENNNEDDIVSICIISDRVEGLLGTLGSISLHSATPSLISVTLITTERRILKRLEEEGGELYQLHIRKRLGSIRVVTVEEAVDSLTTLGRVPVWKWAEFGHSGTWDAEEFGPSPSPFPSSSFSSSNESNRYFTARSASWDKQSMHSNPLNHLRFYLPHLPLFRGQRRLLFIDDDVVVQGDVQLAWEQGGRAVGGRGDGRGRALLATCNLWEFDKSSMIFKLRNQLRPLASSPALVLTGRTEEETACPPLSPDLACVDPGLWPLLRNLSHAINGGRRLRLEREYEWNFGMVLMDLSSWRLLDLTGRYEKWMRANYKYRIFPESSLSYGLGIPILALLGHTSCWELRTGLTIHDGLGFVTFEEWRQSGMAWGDLTSAFAVHYDGLSKPWKKVEKEGDRDIAAGTQRTTQKEKKNGLSAPRSFNVLDFPYHRVRDLRVGQDDDGDEAKIDNQIHSDARDSGGDSLHRHYHHQQPWQLQRLASPRSFMFFTEVLKDSDWLFELLDYLPGVCARGGGAPSGTRLAFPLAAANPAVLHQGEDHRSTEAQLVSGCTFSFIMNWMRKISTHNRSSSNNTFCASDDMPGVWEKGEEWPSHMRIHAQRLCNFQRLLQSRRHDRHNSKEESSAEGEDPNLSSVSSSSSLSSSLTRREVFESYFELALHADNRFLPCQCPLYTEARVQFQHLQWVRYQPGMEEIDTYPLLRRTHTGVIFIRARSRFHLFLNEWFSGGVKARRAGAEGGGVQASDSNRISPDEMMQTISAQRSRQRYIRGQLRRFHIPVLELTYEKCFISPEDCLARMARFVMVTMPTETKSSALLAERIKEKRPSDAFSHIELLLEQKQQQQQQQQPHRQRNSNKAMSIGRRNLTMGTVSNLEELMKHYTLMNSDKKKKR